MRNVGWSKQDRPLVHRGRARQSERVAAVLRRSILLVAGVVLGTASQARAQTTGPSVHNQLPPESQEQFVQPQGPNAATPPVAITLQDAIERARKVDAQFQAALTAAKSGQEDRLQARNAILPSFSYRSEALLTEGNGGRTPVGRFVTNDGVHVYRSWGILHEDLSPDKYLGTGYGRAKVAEAIANAQAEMARRGLTLTVTRLYYTLAVAQRKYATAQAARDTARHFYTITQDAERVGQVAHSDVVQAEIQYRQAEEAFEDANLAMESGRMDLAVLLFPALNENFTIVDDMDSPLPLPPFSETERMAEHENPDLRVAMESLQSANLGVTAAKGAFLPAFYTDSIYGIEANSFALHSVSVGDPKAGSLPNLGYFITVGVNVPLWDWGTLRSKLHQAEYQREQARFELSQAQRQLLSNLYGSYDEATVARARVEESRGTADLAAESLRLIDLRYKAGASTALEVVTAENTLTQARNAYADAEMHYRVTVATLQTVTGSF